MKKSWLLLILLLSFLIGGCNSLKTPEEIIGPPEVDLEKKIINDLVLSFIPANSELLIIPVEQSDINTEPLLEVNLDNDNDKEILALYRDKTTRKIGLILLDSNQESWTKKYELKLDAFEVADYSVVDLNHDGNFEIILGYFSVTDPYKELIILGNKGNGIEKLYETKYLAIDINDLNPQQEAEIAISVSGNVNNNRFVILNYKNDMIQKIGEMIYPEDVEIYKISYSKINDNVSAYFVDMYINESTGRTDALSFVNGDLSSILKQNGIMDITQKIPMTSKDINGDGKTELISNEVVFESEGIAKLVLSKYYTLNSNMELVLVSQFYDDYDLNIKIGLAPTIRGTIEVEKIENMLNFKYKNQQNNSESIFLTVVETANNGIGEYGQGFENILERGERFVFAKVSDSSNLTGLDKAEFDSLIQSVNNLSDVIKYID